MSCGSRETSRSTMRNADSQSCASAYFRTCFCQSGVWDFPHRGEAPKSDPSSKTGISILREGRAPTHEGSSMLWTANILETHICGYMLQGVRHYFYEI